MKSGEVQGLGVGPGVKHWVGRKTCMGKSERDQNGYNSNMLSFQDYFKLLFCLFVFVGLFVC